MALTFAVGADPALVAKIQLRLGRQKPQCLNCGHNLGQREVKRGRICLDRDACRIRRCFRRCTAANA